MNVRDTEPMNITGGINKLSTQLDEAMKLI